MARRTIEGTNFDLAPGEKVLVRVERELFPYWAVLGLAGALLVGYGLSDPIYGWGVFFLGIIVMAVIGGAITSVKVHVTDRRVVQTGYLGVKQVPLAGMRVARGKALFLDRLVVQGGGGRIRVWGVRDGEAIEALLRRQTVPA